MIDFEDYKKIEVSNFDTSNINQKYIISLNNRHFEINEPVARFIKTLQNTDSVSDVALLYYKKNGEQYSEEEIIVILEKIINPLLVLVEKTKRVKPLIFNIELIQDKYISYFSNILKILFNKYIMTILISVIVICEFIFFSSSLGKISMSQVDLYIIGGVLILFILSSFIHELGHASSCKHFKVNHGGVGFGLYMNFPVFYTDVSEIWKLSRMKRLLVNISGVYFQLIFLIPLFIIYFYTYNNLLKYFIITVNINLLITLNPFLNLMDIGSCLTYWVFPI